MGRPPGPLIFTEDPSLAIAAPSKSLSVYRMEGSKT